MADSMAEWKVVLWAADLAVWRVEPRAESRGLKWADMWGQRQAGWKAGKLVVKWVDRSADLKGRQTAGCWVQKSADTMGRVTVANLVAKTAVYWVARLVAAKETPRAVMSAVATAVWRAARWAFYSAVWWAGGWVDVTADRRAALKAVEKAGMSACGWAGSRVVRSEAERADQMGAPSVGKWDI
jgi:hypothetical protein